MGLHTGMNIVLNMLPFLKKENKPVRSHAVCVFPIYTFVPAQKFSHNWYKYYVICSHPSIIHCNVLQYVITNVLC